MLSTSTDKAYLSPAWALMDTGPFLSPEWSWQLGNGLRVVVQSLEPGSPVVFSGPPSGLHAG